LKYSVCDDDSIDEPASAPPTTTQRFFGPDFTNELKGELTYNLYI